MDEQLREEDLTIETYRNGTDLVALRITHQPTGISAEIRDEHSTVRAREKALGLLKKRVAAHEN